jgi:protein-tyrosine-phosphatase
MKTGKAILLWTLLAGLGTQVCPAKVYLRWTESRFPVAKALGVNEIVIPWNESAGSLLAEAKRQGYLAYLEAGAMQVADAASVVDQVGGAGIVLRGEAAELSGLTAKAKELRKAHPKMKILVLDPRGKQPDMRGWLVFRKDGILQVSSPTSQPWLDANLAMVRYARVFDMTQTPLYSFAWDSSDPLVKERGPKPVDYALAVAEAGAYRADLLLEVHEAQQKGLLSGDKDALADWEQVKGYLEFYKMGEGDKPEAEARVAVLTEDYETSYESLNLMARHNIPFRVLKSSQAKASDLARCEVVIAFADLSTELANAINRFAANGGVVVTVKLRGPFAWESTGTATHNGPSTTYTVGKGRVIALKEAVVDPETFAQDVRRLTVKANLPVSLWNSLTTLVTTYPGKRAGEVFVELVNYDGESTEVQVRVKGSFAIARYESPEKGCCEKLKVAAADGFTEFVVPNLVVGGRVRLE